VDLPNGKSPRRGNAEGQDNRIHKKEGATMAKRRSVVKFEQVDARIDLLIKRQARAAAELRELWIKRRKMVTGKIKVPAPAGVKINLSNSDKVTADEFGDLVPTFGGTAVGGFE
jgi:hypothetical protein